MATDNNIELSARRPIKGSVKELTTSPKDGTLTSKQRYEKEIRKRHRHDNVNITGKRDPYVAFDLKHPGNPVFERIIKERKELEENIDSAMLMLFMKINELKRDGFTYGQTSQSLTLQITKVILPYITNIVNIYPMEMRKKPTKGNMLSGLGV